jgi:hypothetical protein
MTNNNLENIDILDTIELSQNNIETIDPLTITKEQIQIDEKVIQEIQVAEKVKKNSFITAIIAFFKFTLTSSLIFSVLLLTTNYAAYTNIAKSYFNSEEIASSQEKLISSVEASSIKEKFINDRNEKSQTKD